MENGEKSYKSFRIIWFIRIIIWIFICNVELYLVSFLKIL